jgi:hypothetical protein
MVEKQAIKNLAKHEAICHGIAFATKIIANTQKNLHEYGEEMYLKGYNQACKDSGKTE